jgi:zinc protease
MNRSTRSRSRRAFTAAGFAALAVTGALFVADRASAQPKAPDTAALKRPPPKPADPQIPFEKYTLDNGLEVILVQDTSVPLAYVSVWYHVGSGYEVPGKSGFAHLFEHMLFQGSKNVGNDMHFEVLKRIGSSVVNGTTNSDRTNYFEQVPSNQLETALWLESDRMSHLLEILTRESLDNQIEVVRNERRQRYDNVPYGSSRFAQAEALYPEGHPYRYMTIGKHEDLASASVDDVKNFYKTWYVPANATLLVAGDFEVAAAKELVTKWFGSFPKSTKPAVVTVPAPVAATPAKEVTVKDSFAKLPRVLYAYHSPALFAPGDAELDIAADALGLEGTGRLYKILVHDKQLAQSVQVSQNSGQFSSVFEVAVTLRTGADIAEVRKVMDAEVARLRTEPISERELARAVTRFEAGAIYSVESLLGRSERLQSFNHYLGDPGKLTWDLDRYRKTTEDAIRATAAKHLDDAHRVVIITLPDEAQGAKP